MLQWDRGRRLTGYGGNVYKYDAGGIRQSKVANGITHTYSTEGSTIHKETRGSNKLLYIYDESGIAAIEYNGSMYYMQKNLQGDVVGLVGSEIGLYTVVAKYVYDAWGNHKVYNADGSENTSSDFIGNINPWRYRSYYFDAELSFTSLTHRARLTSLTQKNEKILKNNVNRAMLHIS